MIKSKKHSGLSAEEVEHKHYLVLEEDNLTPSEDDSADSIYITKKKRKYTQLLA